jgi:hypothetical protein
MGLMFMAWCLISTRTIVPFTTFELPDRLRSTSKCWTHLYCVSASTSIPMSLLRVGRSSLSEQVTVNTYAVSLSLGSEVRERGRPHFTPVTWCLHVPHRIYGTLRLMTAAAKSPTCNLSILRGMRARKKLIATFLSSFRLLVHASV